MSTVSVLGQMSFSLPINNNRRKKKNVLIESNSSLKPTGNSLSSTNLLAQNELLEMIIFGVMIN
jgi:hypothetical protein